MAILNATTPSASGDIIAVIEAATGAQVFEGARPMKVTVSESARLLAHPLESGGNIVDHRLILPIGLSISFILDARNYRATYQEIRQVVPRFDPAFCSDPNRHLHQPVLARHPPRRRPGAV